jgi:basic membrane protein A and related proteins
MVSRTAIIAIAAAIIVIIAGAGIYALMQPPPVTAKLKIAVLLPGSITDAGFNSAMYTAANEVAQEMGSTVTITIAEGLGQVGVEPTMRDYASQGYSLIFCHTIQYQDPALKIGPEFPNTWFIVSGAYLYNTNVVGLIQPMWEGAYLAGMVAGAITNTSKIGAVAGYDYPETRAVPLAFFDGAEKTKVGVNGTLIFGGVWDDVGKGRESGEALISQGCDVILGRGDGLDLGVIQAASIHSAPGTAQTVYMVGDIADQHALAPKTIITSNLWLAKPAILNFIDMYKNGTLAANTALASPIRRYEWGIKYGSAGIAPFYGLDYKVPAAVKTMINNCINAIKAGTFAMHLYANGTPWYEGTF